MRIATISVHGCPCIQPGGTDAGGMNVYVDQVAERLARLGNTVRVYSRAHSGIADPPRQRTYDLVHIPVGELSLQKDELPQVLPDFTSSVLEDTNRNSRHHDLITSHYWLSGVVGCELSEIWEIPHLTSFHTLASIKKRVRPEEHEPEVRFKSETRAARKADMVVVWTTGEAKFMTTEFGISSEKIAIVPPGVDTDFFSPTPKTRQSLNRHRILYVGRLDALKGVDLLLEAFAIIVARGVDVELEIVGGGSADEFRSVLGRISRLRLSDRVRLPGVLPQSELPRTYTAADCIVAPSFHETFGLAVLEAASCGTPAIAADVDGLRSIVADGETGYLVRDRNPNSYAEKIIRIVEDPDLRNRMSAAARATAEQLSWDVTVGGLSEIYNRAINSISVRANLR